VAEVRRRLHVPKPRVEPESRSTHTVLVPGADTAVSPSRRTRTLDRKAHRSVTIVAAAPTWLPSRDAGLHALLSLWAVHGGRGRATLERWLANRYFAEDHPTPSG
jgi:hypothetical protein